MRVHYIYFSFGFSRDIYIFFKSKIYYCRVRWWGRDRRDNGEISSANVPSGSLNIYLSREILLSTKRIVYHTLPKKKHIPHWQLTLVLTALTTYELAPEMFCTRIYIYIIHTIADIYFYLLQLIYSYFSRILFTSSDVI